MMHHYYPQEVHYTLEEQNHLMSNCERNKGPRKKSIYIINFYNQITPFKTYWLNRTRRYFSIFLYQRFKITCKNISTFWFFEVTTQIRVHFYHLGRLILFSYRFMVNFKVDLPKQKIFHFGLF